MSLAIVTGPPFRAERAAELASLGFEVLNGTEAILERLGVPPGDRNRELTDAELSSILESASIYVYGGLEVASAKALEHAGGLRLIAFLGTGWSDEGCVDAAASNRLRIPVSNTPAANAASVAEMAIALTLALQRRIVDLNAATKAGTGRPVKTRDISGKRLGVVGLGAIGSRVARHAVRGFSMDVVYTGPHAKPDLESELGVRRLTLNELLQTSDFVSLHCPARSTTGLVGQEELALMKSSACLINLSSPEVVDGRALLAALQRGTLRAAAVDGIYKSPEDLKSAFLGLDDQKLVVLPRVAWLTEDSYERMAEMAINNVRDLLSGESPRNLANSPAAR